MEMSIAGMSNTVLEGPLSCSIYYPTSLSRSSGLRNVQVGAFEQVGAKLCRKLAF